MILSWQSRWLGFRSLVAPQDAQMAFMARKQRIEVAVGCQIPENDGRRHALTIKVTIEIKSSMDGDVEGGACATDNSDDEDGLDFLNATSPRGVDRDDENLVDCSNTTSLWGVECEGENRMDYSNAVSPRVMELVSPRVMESVTDKDKGDVVPKDKGDVVAEELGEDIGVVKGKGKEKGVVSDVGEFVGDGNAKSMEKAAALAEFQRLRKHKVLNHINTTLEKQIQLRRADVKRLEKALEKKQKLVNSMHEDLNSSYAITDSALIECEKLDVLLRKSEVERDAVKKLAGERLEALKITEEDYER
ncbi:hypothetical protein RJ641_002158 [Dillenia turbinata]|uniref:Uncharacterized protein n=1 Tax=Dillenia turbinata TaxID=194707 RepID=A0AAN8ZA64_9MAGN